VITEWLLTAFQWLLHALLTALPTVSVPSWLSGNDTAFSGVFQAAGSMGVWFPSTLVISVVTGVLALWMVGFGIKLVRIVASFFTAGGGSAA
jgi:hypothetical protein